MDKDTAKVLTKCFQWNQEEDYLNWRILCVELSAVHIINNLQ